MQITQIQTPYQTRMQKIAENHGLQEQYNTLLLQGHKKYHKMIELLKKNKGDVQIAAQCLQEQHKENLNYEGQIQYLIAQGIQRRPHKMIKILSKFGGDQEKALEFFLAKDLQKNDRKRGRCVEMRGEKKRNLVNQQSLEQYKDQILYLAQKGYMNTRKIVKILHKCNGNKEQADEELKRIEKEENEECDKIIYLVQNSGFKKIKQIKKILYKCQGDQQLALQKILDKMKKIQLLQTQYKDQVQFLMMNSNEKPQKMYKALEQAGGNQEQALHILQNFKTGKCNKEDKECEPSQDFIDSNIDRLYIDGNNLLYVDDQIRKVMIKGKNFKHAERMLTDLIRNFIISKQIKSTVLVYDDMGKSQKIIDHQNNFVVESAKPQFSSSDDYLVNASKNEVGKNVVYVTSDRELQQRLGQNGAIKIMKSKQLFKSIKKCLGDEIYDIILGMNKITIE